MEVIALSGNLAKALNLQQKAGLLVQRIAKNSPAALAGLKPGTIHIDTGDRKLLIGGDIITEIEGIQYSTEEKKIKEILTKIDKRIESNKSIRLHVLRSGKIIKVEVGG